MLNGNVRRRTSEQVKKDLETKKAATAAAERSIDTAKTICERKTFSGKSNQFVLTFKILPAITLAPSNLI